MVISGQNHNAWERQIITGESAKTLPELLLAGLHPVGDVPEDLLDIVSETVDEGAPAVEARKGPADVQAADGGFPHRGDHRISIPVRPQLAPLDGDPLRPVAGRAEDPVEFPLVT